MEPNWEEFRIDYTWDNEGTKERKLHGFMRAFIDWRKQEREKSRTNKPPKKKAGKKRN